MTLTETIQPLETGLKEALKRLRTQEKALAELVAAEKDADVPRLHAALAELDPSALAPLGLGESAAVAVNAGRERLAELRTEQRRELARALEVASAAAGRPFRRLTDTPPELRVAPFTVVVDLERMEASLRYAREELERVPAKAEAILKAALAAEKRLTDKALPVEELFDLLVSAYRAAAAARGVPAGERVELADVLPQVAIALQGRRFLEDPVREAFASYPKARFCYDLARLRTARLLERGAFRLDLGTATGDSVKKKGRVFFLENADGEGQYYLSIRFVAARSTLV